MILTPLVKILLEKANAIQEEFGAAQLCPAHVAAAAADFCKVPYTGFAVSDTTGQPRFEEERLRYLMAKEVKLSSYFRMNLRQNAKKGIEEAAFDLEACARLAALRGAPLLSADVVVLCVLLQLPDAYQSTVRTVRTQNDVLVLLDDTDRHIYDYVIEQTQKLSQALQQKAWEAAALRDWKPAAKFAQPADLAAMFFAKAETVLCGNVLTLKLPKFFGRAGLKLSIHKAGALYYIHDYGCAVQHLEKQVQNAESCGRILDKVCHHSFLEGRRVTGSFCDGRGFLRYLQMLVMVAQAGLYHTKLQRRLYPREKGYAYVHPSKAEPMDEAALLEILRGGVGFGYDEQQGLYCWADVRASLNTSRIFFLLETLEDGQVRISDRKKGKFEGEIFENFYWSHDDIGPYGKFVETLAAHFGGRFDGRDVYLMGKQGDFAPLLLRFFNLAMVISEFGNGIPVPRRKG